MFWILHVRILYICLPMNFMRCANREVSEKNDILVCKYTDPEWTPLFALAAGVVVDTGVTLSHAAIVAREYNIPAVLATGDATEKLKDGDIVLVNATERSVVLLK